jgi:signal transduction histidine kinase
MSPWTASAACRKKDGVPVEARVAAILRARSELVNAERLAAIGKMAAHVTHEIRNPLSSIGLNLELLDGSARPAEEWVAI